MARLPLQYGNKSTDILVAQRFLVKHGFMTFQQINTNPGMFGDATRDGLIRFSASIGRTGHLPTTQITQKTLDEMAAFEGRYLNEYRRSPAYFDRARIYTYHPETETVHTPGKAPVRGRDFHPRRVTFVIDPGHGVDKHAGRDQGSSVTVNRKTIYEADVAQALSQDVARALQRRGFSVLISHNGGYPDSGDGFAFRHDAARLGTAAYLSLHTDIAGNKNVHGARVFVDSRTPRGSESRVLRQEIAGSHGKSDPVVDPIHRERHLAMLSPRHMGVIPAVLIENGFLTNASDRARLTNPTRRARYADALAADLAHYIDMGADLRALGGRGRSRTQYATVPEPVETKDSSNQFYYGVDKKDSFYSVAKQFGVDPKQLMAANPESARKGLEADDELLIPGMRSVRVRDNLISELDRAYNKDHSLKAGEHRPTTSELVRLVAKINEVRPSRVRADQPLAIPKDLHTANEVMARTGLAAEVVVNQARVAAKPYFYYAAPGEGYISIARKFDIDPEALRRANPDVGGIEKGERLILPSHQQVEQQEQKFYHRVTKGEGYIAIAQHYHIDPELLKRANGNAKLDPGDRLVIPGYHAVHVARGDTLSGIATDMRAKCSIAQGVAALGSINHVTPRSLKADSVLAIPDASILGDICPAKPPAPRPAVRSKP